MPDSTPPPRPGPAAPQGTNIRIDMPDQKSGSSLGIVALVAVFLAVLGLGAYFVMSNDGLAPAGGTPSISIENNAAPAAPAAPAPAAPAPAPAPAAPAEPAPAAPAAPRPGP